MIKKVKGGYKIFHCSSGKKGSIKATPKPVSHKKALAIHRAIQARKHGYLKGSGILSGNPCLKKIGAL